MSQSVVLEIILHVDSKPERAVVVPDLAGGILTKLVRIRIFRGSTVS
jgi:hypothetical protein